MGWLFNIQSAQCYFAVGALLKTKELGETELVQSTRLGSARQSLHSFKLFQRVLVSCIRACLALSEGRSLLLILILCLGLDFEQSELVSSVLGGNLSVYLNVCGGDAPDEAVHEDHKNTNLLVLLAKNALDVVCQSPSLLGKRGMGDVSGQSDLTSIVSIKGQNTPTKWGVSNCQD